MKIAAVCIVSALTHELQTLQEMDAAFQERQSIGSFEVHWDAQLTVIENPEAIPAERRHAVFECPPQSFAVEGDCVRYRGFRDPFYEKVGSELTDYVSYFDGQNSLICRITGRERRQIAELRKRKTFDDSQNFTFGPVWMHFCTDHHVGIRLRSDQLKLLPEWETVNGTRCRILTGARNQYPFRVFVAPERDYAIVRFVEYSPGSDLRSYQVDTQFQTIAGRIVPAGWHAQWFSGGMIHQTLKATVQRMTLNREPDQNHLRPTLSPGTQVQDIPEGIIYHVADDGSYEVERRMRRSVPPPMRRIRGFVLPNPLPPGAILDVPQ